MLDPVLPKGYNKRINSRHLLLADNGHIQSATFHRSLMSALVDTYYSYRSDRAMELAKRLATEKMRDADAIILYGKAVRQSRRLIDLGNRLLRDGNDAKALHLFNKALLRNPDLAAAYYNIGKILHDMNEHGRSHVLMMTPLEALSLSTRYGSAAVALDDTLSPHAYRSSSDRIGMSNPEIQRMKLEDLKNLLRFGRSDAIVHSEIGGVYLLVGDIHSAKTHFHEALSLNQETKILNEEAVAEITKHLGDIKKLLKNSYAARF